MANKMLIDASHPEETRVVVVRGNRVEEFDFESANRKQLRGNIYLAKVTRVEPSLQAAFVEYGGNRHGFLAFSEIHPDYYQIPVADRQALLAEEAQAEREAEKDEERAARRRQAKRSRKGDDAIVSAEPGADDGAAAHDSEGAEANGEEEVIEHLGGADVGEEVPDRRHRPLRRQYKIQEVIKRRQVLLVQVVKEERGNKGAALTTYLSLAGRYSVLMPNTARGGGISRKITNVTDRKRLKTIAQELDVPEGMGVILRTAGASRTKAEIKRDFEYLLRMWESVRELTLKSTAPALVYEEGSLIKRAIRDLYNKDIDEVQVSGDDGYREAKDFMRMLMPSHAKVVKPYRDPQPLFAKFGVEAQLDAMFSNQVTLKSGGYIVINPTEALVSIDVNSGRSTREHNIEDTALKTNLEAAEEISRQLRLRDLAGLIVIDFIDMEEKRNNRAVEKKLKECLKNDRARIQVGRISAFGLLEMSRQRIRTGVLESSTVVCHHCGGSGFVRATASVALHILRSIEEALLKSAAHNVVVKTRTEVALYILNQKRVHLRELETRFDVGIAIFGDDTLSGTTNFTIERGEAVLRSEARAPATGIRIESAPAIEEEAEVADEDEEVTEEAPQQARGPQDGTEDGNGKRRRRRRRRRGGRGGEGREAAAPAGAEPATALESQDDEESGSQTAGTEDPAQIVAEAAVGLPTETPAEETEGSAPAKRRRTRRPARGKRAADEAGNAAEAAVEAETESPADAVEEQAAAVPPEQPLPVVEAAPTPAPQKPAEPEPVEEDANRPKRTGWWARAKASLTGG
ncbi:ribonuclease E/G [Chelatococcus daeguensis]|uniref:Ribonuclease E n=1 Tax=Chelatococcus sambhunathii TaxID=363953 RepID=A0ABP2A0D3_9HYPH|nr:MULTISPECIES: ribonuclease E/G [Chelatococcus]KZE35537.1 ribonuclease E [Chelatococcus daeguensis]MBM3085544.1 ribonuclease E/G [Chelatococcus daeguensis]CUA85986.1 ribonuclease, Rne/Rng family [Chelatococcus sambhunathii]